MKMKLSAVVTLLSLLLMVTIVPAHASSCSSLDPTAIFSMTNTAGIFSTTNIGLLSYPAPTPENAVEVGTEAVQILGQIVVDRASAQAYDLIKKKLRNLLGCDETQTITHAFTETCNVLKSLRLQDVAQSPSLFYKSLAIDGFRNTVEGVNISDTEIDDIVVSAISESRLKRDSLLSEMTISELFDLIANKMKINKNQQGNMLDDGQKAVRLAYIAIICCHVTSPKSTTCPLYLINAYANQLTGTTYSTSEIRFGAKKLAINIIRALSFTQPTGGDPNNNLYAAIKAYFDGICMLEEGNANGCDEPITVSEYKKSITMLKRSRDVVLSAIDGDNNELIKNLYLAEITDESDSRDKEQLQQIFYICGSLLNYASTYSSDNADIQSANENRTKILESLTESMTNRTGRDGDSIFSFGGSLRVAVGDRFRRDNAFYGPVSLPLGIGWDTSSGTITFFRSWHFEISMLDLGQYMSFQESGTVQQPKLADALAPSLTIGHPVYNTQQFPVFLAGTMGYSPQYKFKDSNANNRGAFFAGLVFGIYVPFIDLD